MQGLLQQRLSPARKVISAKWHHSRPQHFLAVLGTLTGQHRAQAHVPNPKLLLFILFYALGQQGQPIHRTIKAASLEPRHKAVDEPDSHPVQVMTSQLLTENQAHELGLFSQVSEGDEFLFLGEEPLGVVETPGEQLAAGAGVEAEVVLKYIIFECLYCIAVQMLALWLLHCLGTPITEL